MSLHPLASWRRLLCHCTLLRMSLHLPPLLRTLLHLPAPLKMSLCLHAPLTTLLLLDNISLKSIWSRGPGPLFWHFGSHALRGDLCHKYLSASQLPVQMAVSLLCFEFLLSFVYITMCILCPPLSCHWLFSLLHLDCVYLVCDYFAYLCLFFFVSVQSLVCVNVCFCACFSHVFFFLLLGLVIILTS